MAVCIATIQIDYLFIVLFSQKHETLASSTLCSEYKFSQSRVRAQYPYTQISGKPAGIPY